MPVDIKRALSDNLPIVVGRHPLCNLVGPSERLSRRHLIVTKVGDKLAIRDLGSTNGVRVNGHSVQVATVGEGDEVLIGGVYWLVVTWEGSDLFLGLSDQRSVLGTLMPPAQDDAESPSELDISLQPEPAEDSPLIVVYVVFHPDRDPEPLPEAKPGEHRTTNEVPVLGPPAQDDVVEPPVQPNQGDAVGPPDQPAEGEV